MVSIGARYCKDRHVTFLHPSRLTVGDFNVERAPVLEVPFIFVYGDQQKIHRVGDGVFDAGARQHVADGNLRYANF